MNKRICIWIALGCGVLWTTLPGGLSATSQPEADLLDLVEQGSKASSDAVTSGWGKITVASWGRNWDGGVQESETVYAAAFAGDRFRVSAVRTFTRNTLGPNEDLKLAVAAGTVWRHEAMYDPSRVTIYYPDANAANIFAERHNGELRNISPRHLGLSEISGNAVLTANYAELDGVTCILLEGRYERDDGLVTFVRCWVDEERGFVLRKYQVFAQDNTHPELVLLDETNVEVRDYGGGLWGPKKCTKVRYREDRDGEIRKWSETTTTYDPGFQLNAPVDEQQLVLDLPSGTKVYDKVLDATYSVP